LLLVATSGAIAPAGGDAKFGTPPPDNRICSDIAKVCPNGKTVVEVPPDCHFQPCGGPTSGTCKCGDPCNKKGTPGFCGPNGACRTGANRPSCDPKHCVTPFCPKIDCPPSQQQKHKGADGCPGCPICHKGGCDSDKDCPAGETCVMVGKFKTCKANGKTCGLVNPATGGSISSGAFGNGCPAGERCVNGQCKRCLQIDCVPPPCIGGHLIPGPVVDGCPGCSHCSCTGDDCLPCCPPVEKVGQPACRACGVLG